MKRLSVLLLVCAAVALTPTDAPSCGPFFEAPAFLPKHFPAVPLSDFQAGKLGIVQGSHWLEYLIPAWRHLAGKPISKIAPEPAADSPDINIERNNWLSVRARIMQQSIEGPGDYRRIGARSWPEYLNCNAFTFKTAAATLHARVDQFGGQHPAIKAWIKAQDIVLSNCAKGESIPDPPEPDLPALFAADRQYQIAAAQFYAKNFDAARKSFLNIAEHKSSPWRDIAPYLAARALIRQATLTSPERGFDAETLSRADEELGAIERGSPDSKVRAWAQQLRTFVANKLRPGDRLAALASALSDAKQDNQFAGNLAEFDHVWVSSGVAEPAYGKSELLDWLYAMRGKIDRDVILRRWSEEQSEPWLIAALAATNRDDAGADLLTAAATKVAPASPAYATVSFHRLRLTEGKESVDVLRATLDEMLVNLRRSLPAAALNPFLERRFALARNFDEFLMYAPRAPTGATGPQVLFDTDAELSFNTALPLSRWVEASQSKHLDNQLQDRIIQAAWVRAELLEDTATAAVLTKRLRERTPEIGALLDSYENAQTPEEKRFRSVYLMLKTPGLSPHLRVKINRHEAVNVMSDLRDNWWCGDGSHRFSYLESEQQRHMPAPAFLPDSEREQAASERKRIVSRGAAASHFSEHVVTWARQHPTDPRSPEALHLVVMAGKLGCRDDGTGPASKRAFELLHRLYSKSEWAKKTPYWYGKEF